MVNKLINLNNRLKIKFNRIFKIKKLLDLKTPKYCPKI